jgi:hypothetical protein
VTLLRHSVVQHPFRRGHLRDVILLADELSADPDIAIGAVARAIAGDVYEVELREMLGQVEGFRRKCIGPDPIGLLTFVAWKYYLVLRSEAPIGRVSRDRLHLAHLALERPAIRRARLLDELGLGHRQDALDARIRSERFRSIIPAPAILGARWLYRAFLAASVIATGPARRRQVGRLTEAPSASTRA